MLQPEKPRVAMASPRVLHRRWQRAGLVLETEDSFRLAHENFLAEGEHQLLEQLLQVGPWEVKPPGGPLGMPLGSNIGQ